MKASEKCYALIKHFEGYVSKAKPCPVGIPTCGYGHTKGVKNGDLCSLEQADIYLHQDVAGVENDLLKALNADEIEVTQGQFDALVSFSFNIRGGVSTLIRSTLYKCLRAGNVQNAADEFLRWKFGTRPTGEKIVLNGLVARRKAERDLFLS